MEGVRGCGVAAPVAVYALAAGGLLAFNPLWLPTSALTLPRHVEDVCIQGPRLPICLTCLDTLPMQRAAPRVVS